MKFELMYNEQCEREHSKTLDLALFRVKFSHRSNIDSYTVAANQAVYMLALRTDAFVFSVRLGFC